MSRVSFFMRMRSSCSACCWLKWLAARCEDSGTFRILNCKQKGLRNQDVRSRLTFRRIVNCKKQVYVQIYLVFLSSVGDWTVCVCYNFPQATSWTHPTASAQTIHSLVNTHFDTDLLLVAFPGQHNKLHGVNVIFCLSCAYRGGAFL